MSIGFPLKQSVSVSLTNLYAYYNAGVLAIRIGFWRI